MDANPTQLCAQNILELALRIFKAGIGNMHRATHCDIAFGVPLQLRLGIGYCADPSAADPSQFVRFTKGRIACSVWKFKGPFHSPLNGSNFPAPLAWPMPCSGRAGSKACSCTWRLHRESARTPPMQGRIQFTETSVNPLSHWAMCPLARAKPPRNSVLSPGLWFTVRLAFNA